MSTNLRILYLRAREFSVQTIDNCRRQELIDTGQFPGTTSTDHAVLAASWREDETSLLIACSSRVSASSRVTALPSRRISTTKTSPFVQDHRAFRGEKPLREEFHLSSLPLSH
ncbi:hypothetical protein [Saccharopolyspora hattusasensis]|uniref:hypothetical protein n=1 Tax=Saccharopolyspora hattusasensis TaxID=1128679 RepID=UPI003D992FF7